MILIKDMKMPKWCPGCPLYDNEYGWCKTNKDIVINFDERPSNCPLIEIAEVQDAVSRQAVMALDMFTKIFCRDYAVQDDLAFRCNQCEFEMSNGKCLAKVMARKICPDYKDFGSMGDL